jgi:hypothetical protein
MYFIFKNDSSLRLRRSDQEGQFSPWRTDCPPRILEAYADFSLLYIYHHWQHRPTFLELKLRLSFATDIMVSSNPLFRGGVTLKKLQATVISEIWPEIVFFTLIATSKHFVAFVS